MSFYFDLGCYFVASPMTSPTFGEYHFWGVEEDSTASDDFGNSSSEDESQDEFSEDESQDEFSEDESQGEFSDDNYYGERYINDSAHPDFNEKSENYG